MVRESFFFPTRRAAGLAWRDGNRVLGQPAFFPAAHVQTKYSKSLVTVCIVIVGFCAVCVGVRLPMAHQTAVCAQSTVVLCCPPPAPSEHPGGPLLPNYWLRDPLQRALIFCLGREAGCPRC